MRKLFITLCVAGVALSACLSNPAPLRYGDEEYAVYSAIIREKYLHRGVQQIVINEQTERYQRDPSRESVWDEITVIKEAFAIWSIRADTVADYIAQNKAQHRLENRFTLPVPVSLLSSKENEEIFSQPGLQEMWQRFYQRYPKSPGLLTLSRVGFNYTRNQALVYVACSCGSLCGVGEYYFLVKTDGVWKFEMARQLWVS